MSKNDIERAAGYDPRKAPTLYDWLIRIQGMTHGVALDLDDRIPDSADMPTPQSLWTMAGVNRERRGKMEINILPSLLDFFDQVQAMVAEAQQSPEYQGAYDRAFAASLRKGSDRETAHDRAGGNAMYSVTKSRYAEMYHRRAELKGEAMERAGKFRDSPATFEKVLHSRVRRDVIQMFLGHVWAACWWIDRGYAPPITFSKPIQPEVPYPGTPEWDHLAEATSSGGTAGHLAGSGG